MTDDAVDPDELKTIHAAIKAVESALEPYDSGMQYAVASMVVLECLKALGHRHGWTVALDAALKTGNDLCRDVMKIAEAHGYPEPTP